MALENVKQDQYILGQSVTKTIKELAEEIRLDLSLIPNPNLNSGTIIGIIKDENGSPIKDALIKIMSNDHEPLAHTFTGTDGSYIFSPFAPGTNYHIYATKQGYGLAENLPFTLLPNQQVVKDFILVPDASATLAIIAGDVFNSITKAPINGAAINLYSVNDGGVEALFAISFTNQYGQYVFSDLPLGNYVVRISALGYNPTAATVLLNLPGQIGNIVTDISSDPNSSRGTVSGIITNDNNQPIGGADVTLYKVGKDEALTAIAFQKTNTEGVYLFINVPQGSYKIKSNKSVIPQVVL